MKAPPATLRLLLASCSALLLAMGILGLALAHEGQGDVVVAEVDGMINPVTQRFIERVVEEGESLDAELVVILLDTPGGLLDSTEKIVEVLLSDRVPTAVYVWPRGAFAASAGTFITAAANFAVMAPGTSIGAASPVSGGGEELPETLSKKVTNAVDAMVRSIADVRGRNADALSDTVREATAYKATEAVELGVVDFIAEDLDDLLARLDGQTVTTAQGTRTLSTSGLVRHEIKMSLIERFLFFLADPNVAFLLLSLGGLGLVVELFNPGLIVPGVAGVIFLILAFLSIGNLPVNWAGVALILLAMVLLIAELLVAGFGALGIGSIVAFVLGSLILFSEAKLPGAPSVGVSLWLLVPFTIVVFVGGGYVMWTIAQSRKEVLVREVASSLVGHTGLVVAELAPRGTVRLQNELWTAIALEGAPIDEGVLVRVVEVEGIVLMVVRVDGQETAVSPVE